MPKNRFYEDMKNAKEEREVENVYNQGINLYFLKEDNETISHPFKCDGLVEYKDFLKLIIEYKYKHNLHNNVDKAKVINKG